MKTIFATALLTLLSTSVISAQSKVADDKIPNVTFCTAEKSNDTIKYSDLGKCDEITQPYKELRIKSFNISFLMPSADGKGEGIFMDVDNISGKLNQQTLEILKTLKAKKVKKLFIGHVIVIEANGITERKMKGIVVNLN